MERFPLGRQSKKNIGEGKVLAGLIRRGELPEGTTLAEARQFAIDLSKRPRKGKRKKGLLPELTKKEYRLQLGKKIKDFTADEKRVYNALAKREKRGYVVKEVEDFAGELEDFLADDEEEQDASLAEELEGLFGEEPLEEQLALGGGGIEAVIEDAPPPQEVKIPQGVSTAVEIEDFYEETDSDVESEFEEDDIEWISAIPKEKPIVEGTLKDIETFIQGKDPITKADTISKQERSQRALQLGMGGIRQSKEDKDAIKQKIRERNKARELERIRKKEEKVKAKLREAEEELVRRERQEEEAIARKQRDIESRRALGLPDEPMTAEELQALREENDRREALEEERARKKPVGRRVREIEEDIEEAEELEEFLLDTPPQTPPIPTQLEQFPISPIPSPSFQPPDQIYFDQPYGASPATRRRDDEDPTDLPTPNSRALLRRIPSGERVRPTPPTRQSRVVANPVNARRALEEAGVGNLSLGGATQSYRLLDFEARPFNMANPRQTQPIFQTLLKNNKDRRKK